MTRGAVAIDLWLWSLDCGAVEADLRSTVLSAAERDRAGRFVQERDRIRFVSGRWRMREILADIVGTSAAALPLAEGLNGKPVLSEGPVFNLSHAAGLAALAVTADRSVLLGVDIEGARPVGAGLARLAFAPEERAALQALDPSARDWAFFLGWTRKEAVVKASGAGLRADLSGFAVTLEQDAARLLRIDGDSTENWRLHDFRPRHDLAGAIACRTEGREIVVSRRA